MKKKRPTLQDIADHVGATKMTVSRCLRDPETVSESLRDHIFLIAEQIGYIPNRAPDLLSRATSHSIGVLVPSLTNQVFADVIVGIETLTEPAGFHGHDVGQVMTPRLASVITPRQAIGEAAARELLARIRGEPITQKVVDLGYRIEVGMTL